MLRPESLPEFEHPPIDEVVIGVQYMPLSGFTDAHAGLYWQNVKDEFPSAESHPRLDSDLEDLEVRHQNMIRVGVAEGPQGRTWLKTADGEQLVQIQNDRFLQNWRRRGEGEYPRFNSLLPSFQERFRTFRDVLVAEGFEAPGVRQVEVAYINWVPDMGMADFFMPARSSQLEMRGVEPLSDFQQASRYLVFGAHEEPVARLQTQCVKALRQATLEEPERLGVQLQLSFRAPSAEEMTDAEIQDRALLGRETIVNAFSALTTPEAHEKWARR